MREIVIKCIFIVGILFKNSSSFPYFQRNVPNGALVANPCNSLELWPGVGHWNIDGGGNRNPFGKQFEANSYTWTSALCNADSDEDGRSNGEELGDPNCSWRPGTQPSRRSSITHPGICEPIESPLCKRMNTFLKCTSSDICPLLDEPDVKNISLTFPRTNIPAQDTNYFCRIFKFPTDNLYDMIATKPIVDNKLVVHHMQLYGCENDANLPNIDGKIFACTMGVPGHCTSIMALWSLGADGDCLSEEYGYRIGYNSVTKVSGFRYAALEIHWTNYDLLANQYDSSGLNIFYTPNLRPNKAAILQLGQYDITIPPKTKQTIVQATCSSTCSTKTLKTPVKIAQAAVHAHLLGKNASVELHRDGQFLTYILNKYSIDFNFPQMYLLEPAVDYLPGDVIKVNCFFDSSDRSVVTNYGDGTRDEMCIGYFVYYPAQEPVAFTNCGQWRDVSLCNDVEEVASCSTNLLADFKRNILASCSSGCTTRCKSAIEAMFKTECGSDSYLTELGKNPVYYDLLDIIDKCLPAAKYMNTMVNKKNTEDKKGKKGTRANIRRKIDSSAKKTKMASYLKKIFASDKEINRFLDSLNK